MLSKVVVVTGANKGIGRAIVKELATKSTQEWKSSESVTIYLTARNPELGTKALEELEEEVKGQKPDNYKLKFEILDVTSEDSISKIGDYVEKEHQGLDILINNAGIGNIIHIVEIYIDHSIAFRDLGLDYDVVRKTFNTNYYGVLNMMKKFLPLMKKDGRIINVSSMLGELFYVSEELKRKLLDPSLTISELSGILEGFADSVKDNNLQEKGWPTPDSCQLDFLKKPCALFYGVSKIGVTGLSKVYAHEQQKKHESDEPILIRTCCPGYVSTDLNDNTGYLTVEEGAKTPVYLALASKESIIKSSTRKEFKQGMGVYWTDKKVKQW